MKLIGDFGFILTILADSVGEYLENCGLPINCSLSVLAFVYELSLA
jgi:hypothetical protein